MNAYAAANNPAGAAPNANQPAAGGNSPDAGQPAGGGAGGTGSTGGGGGSSATGSWCWPWKSQASWSPAATYNTWFGSGAINRDYQITTRLGGVLTAVDGATEMLVGGAAFAAGSAESATAVGAPVGIPTLIGGTVLAAHGSDKLTTGFRSIVDGKPHRTLTSQGLDLVTGNPATSDLVEGVGSGVGTAKVGTIVLGAKNATANAAAVTKQEANAAATAVNVPKTGLGGATRLTSEEVATGRRLEAQLGTSLRESSHVGAEYVDDLGRTYDALGKPIASNFWNETEFLASIDSHLLKSNNFTVIDLTGFTPAQIAAVESHLATLTSEQLVRIVRIGF